jgi:protein-S-isoprenylcysteine O-methyltransferase Ste14
MATGALYLTARVEERENLRNFGEEYAVYMRETHMFIPFVF